MASVQLTCKQKKVLRKTLDSEAFPADGASKDIASLAELGLVTASWVPTEAGRAWLMAHPPAPGTLKKGSRVVVQQGCARKRVAAGDIATIADVTQLASDFYEVRLRFEGSRRRVLCDLYVNDPSRLERLSGLGFTILIAPC